MSKNIDDILKEVVKNNKEINTISKDIAEIRKTTKNIDNKIKLLENKIDEAINILNTFTILITENDEDEDIEGDDYLDSESSEWSPYDVPEDYDSDEYDDEDEEN